MRKLFVLVFLACSSISLATTAIAQQKQLGPLEWVADAETFPLYRQTDSENPSLYISSDWANTEYEGVPRKSQTCLAVVYTILEHARGNTDHRIGQTGTWSDELGAIDKFGVVKARDLHPKKETILEELRAGRPIILQGFSQGLGTNHFMLAVGLTASQEFVALDPLSGSEVVIPLDKMVADITQTNGSTLSFTVIYLRTLNYALPDELNESEQVGPGPNETAETVLADTDQISSSPGSDPVSYRSETSLLDGSDLDGMAEFVISTFPTTSEAVQGFLKLESSESIAIVRGSFYAAFLYSYLAETSLPVLAKYFTAEQLGEAFAKYIEAGPTASGANLAADAGKDLAEVYAIDFAASLVTDAVFYFKPENMSPQLESVLRAGLKASIVETIDGLRIYKEVTTEQNPLPLFAKVIERAIEVSEIVKAVNALSQTQDDGLIQTALAIESAAYLLVTYPSEKSKEIARATLTATSKTLPDIVGSDDAEQVARIFNFGFSALRYAYSGNFLRTEQLKSQIIVEGEKDNIGPLALLDPRNWRDWAIASANFGHDAPRRAAAIMIGVTDLSDLSEIATADSVSGETDKKTFDLGLQHGLYAIDPTLCSVEDKVGDAWGTMFQSLSSSSVQRGSERNCDFEAMEIEGDLISASSKCSVEGDTEDESWKWQRISETTFRETEGRHAGKTYSRCTPIEPLEGFESPDTEKELAQSTSISSSKDDFVFVQTHSRREFEEAYKVAQELVGAGAPGVNVFESANGWFAVTAARVSAGDATNSRLQSIIAQYQLPNDSLFTRGDRFVDLRASFESHATRLDITSEKVSQEKNSASATSPATSNMTDAINLTAEEAKAGHVVGDSNALRSITTDNGCSLQLGVEATRLEWSGSCSDGVAKGNGVLTLYNGDYLLERLRVGEGTELLLDNGILKWRNNLAEYSRTGQGRWKGYEASGGGVFEIVSASTPSGYNFQFRPTIDRIARSAYNYFIETGGFLKHDHKGIIIEIPKTPYTNHVTIYLDRNGQVSQFGIENRYARDFDREKNAYNKNVNVQRQATIIRSRYDKKRKELTDEANKLINGEGGSLSALAAAIEIDSIKVLKSLENGNSLEIPYSEEFSSGKTSEGNQVFRVVYRVSSPFGALENQERQELMKVNFSWDKWFDQTSSVGQNKVTIVGCLFKSISEIPKITTSVPVRLSDFSSSNRSVNVTLECG